MLGITSWGWVIKIMNCSCFLIPWWLCLKERLDLCPPKLTFPGSVYSLALQWAEVHIKRTKQNPKPGFPDFTPCLLCWALPWLGKMQNKKGESSDLFAFIDYLLPVSFATIVLSTIQHKVEAKWECENFVLWYWVKESF